MEAGWKNRSKMESKEGPKEQPKEKRSRWRDFLSLGEVGGYFFRKKDPSRPSNINIKMMHGINKLSIAIFLLAVIYLLAKRFLF